MDGVLVDSEPYHLRAYQQLLRQFDIDYTEENNREFLGRTDQAIAKILIERHKLAISSRDFVESKELNLIGLLKEQAQPRPGVVAVLEQGKCLGLPMAVASSALFSTIELVVDTLKIRSYFDTLTSGEEVEHGKPAPDVFLLAAKRLAVEPSSCLVIEDTYNGILAAASAGMKCVAIACDATRHQDHSAADLQLGSMEDLDLAEWISPVAQ